MVVGERAALSQRWKTFGADGAWVLDALGALGGRRCGPSKGSDGFVSAVRPGMGAWTVWGACARTGGAEAVGPVLALAIT
jgi:hypothetical protein